MKVLRTPLLILAGLIGASHLAAQRPGRPQADTLGPRNRMPLAGRLEVLTARRARLGVSVNLRAGATDSIGALIESVTPGGPAARAGIRTGDIIIRLNGQPLVVAEPSPDPDVSPPGLRLPELASQLDAGDTVVVEYRRGVQRHTTRLIAGNEAVFSWGVPQGGWSVLQRGDVFPELQVPTDRETLSAEDLRRGRLRLRLDSIEEPLRRMPVYRAPMVFMLGSPLADLELAPMNPALGRYFGTSDGVLVIRVPQKSTLGLEAGDVVFRVDGRKVVSPGQLFRVLQSYEPGEGFKLDIMRFHKRETVAGQLGPIRRDR